jgi:hypothetical protein
MDRSGGFSGEANPIYRRRLTPGATKTNLGEFAPEQEENLFWLTSGIKFASKMARDLYGIF